MSKTLNGAILHTSKSNPSIIGQVINAALSPSLTKEQALETIDNCDLVNAQITDTIDLIADAVASDETRRLDVANALNLISGISRLNNEILMTLASKLAEGK